jgi:ABC-type transport system substrate-binding protein
MRRTAFASVLALALVGCGSDESSDDAAGGARALSVVLSYGAVSRPYMPNMEEVAKQVAGDLEEAGITVDLKKHEWGPYLTRVKNGEHQLALLGWSADIPDVDNFLYVLLDKSQARPGDANNISFYVDETVHGLLEEARYTYDPARREALYRQAQAKILADAPMVPLAWSDRVLAHRAAVGPIGMELITHPQLRLAEKPRDGRLVIGRSGDAVKLDPAVITDGESSNPVEQIFDNLVRYVPGTAKIEPALAESWTSDAEHKVWTFKLRPGVAFHDGTPCDAAAVANAFERQRDDTHPHHVGGEFAYWTDLLGYVEKVEAAGPLEVVFRCSRPAPAFFIPTLAVFTFAIPSPAALTKHGAQFARNPVGTGPYKFVSWQSDVEIALTRHDGWWGGKPAVKDLVYRKIPDAGTRTQALKSGAVDVIDNVDLATLPQLEADSGIRVVSQPGMHVAYLAMNTQKAPFTDPRVRRAVALALHKKRIVKAGWEGRAQPAVTPVPPNLMAPAADLVDPPRDLAAARRLLAEALSPAPVGR